MCGAQARDRLHFTKEVVQHITPVAHHVENNAAAVFFAVVPAGSLNRLQIAFKHPIAKLNAHAEHLAKEACFSEHVEFAQTGQEQLVLHRAMLDARLFCQARNFNRFVQIGGNGLFAIHMLTRLNGFGQQGGAHLRGTRIKENGVVLVGQRFIKVCAETRDAIGFGQGFNFFSIAANQNGIGHHLVTIGQCHTTLIANGHNRSNQVLIHTHASGHAMHDDAKSLYSHKYLFCV